MLTKFGAVRTRNAKNGNGLLFACRARRADDLQPAEKNLVLDIDYNDAVVVIHTSPGAAQLIARLLDSLGKSRRYSG